MDKRIIAGIFACLALVITVFLLFSPQQSGLAVLQQEEQLTAKIGYVPVLVNLPLFVAIEKGYFEKYGLKVEVTEAQSPNNIVDAIIAGHLDGAGVLAYPVLFAAQAKFPGTIKIFHTGIETTENYVSAIVVRKDSNITSIDDLKGKKIGVYTGLVQVVFLKGIIAGMGLDPQKDIEIVEIAPNLQVQGLEAGQYDALSTVEPYQTIAVSKGIGKIVFDNPRVNFIQNPFPSVATALSTDFIKNNPKAAKAYVLALGDAIDFIKTNPEEAKSFLAKYTPTPKEITSRVKMPEFWKFGEENRAGIQENADWMFKSGLISRSIDVDSMFGSAELVK